ncbi:acyl-CoA-binding protein homolog 1-like isoform X2 [Planococcus citri]|uniref:acyl-CoA-binding protein homolog 1-like isoform X2 n=1 Tax=Planococcus citri TaxID=170843 RepID=UPI0031F976DF
MSDEKFQACVEDVKNLKQTPSNEELLELYALFKQATVGDVNTDRPGIFDLKGKAKWDAWNGKKDTPSDKAKEEYVALVEKLIAAYGKK